MSLGGGSGGFLDYFSALEDPRQAWKVVYPLDEMLLLVLCAVLSDADDFVEISNWGRLRLGFLRRFRPYAQGVPSHDTLNDVYNALDGDQFQACFIAWVEGLCEAEGEIIAIDGKTSRRTGDRRRGRDRHCHVNSVASARPRALAPALDVQDILRGVVTAFHRSSSSMPSGSIRRGGSGEGRAHRGGCLDHGGQRGAAQHRAEGHGRGLPGDAGALGPGERYRDTHG